MFHNLAHSFKQSKLTRRLLAKWRALSADKRPTSHGAVNSVIKDSVRKNLWVSHSSDDEEDDCDDLVAVIEILRDHYDGSDKKLSRSEQFQQKEYHLLVNKSRDIKELTRAL